MRNLRNKSNQETFPTFHKSQTEYPYPVINNHQPQHSGDSSDLLEAALVKEITREKNFTMA